MQVNKKSMSSFINDGHNVTFFYRLGIKNIPKEISLFIGNKIIII